MRSIETIYEKLLADFAQRAGFTPEAGCDLAVRLWAAAAELQSLEIQAEWVLDQRCHIRSWMWVLVTTPESSEEQCALLAGKPPLLPHRTLLR